MTFWDVFNGDADGIIALLQLRLAQPQPSQLITGVKRDIALLKQITAKAGDIVTVLDISMEKNSEALQQVLSAGANVHYVDHHRAGGIPCHSNFTSQIDLSPETCTSLLVNESLKGRFLHWAIAAAYGDNLIATADKLSNEAGLTAEQSKQLKSIGVLINYNGYGQKIEDLHYHPAKLFVQLLEYTSPFELIDDKASVYYQLQEAYSQDMRRANEAQCLFETQACVVYQLPDQAWSRRVSGVWGNELANLAPNRAHGVITDNGDATYTVSVRSPLDNKTGAGDICAQFPTGGGRAAAAGVNQLPHDQLDAFCQALNDYYQRT